MSIVYTPLPKEKTQTTLGSVNVLEYLAWSGCALHTSFANLVNSDPVIVMAVLCCFLCANVSVVLSPVLVCVSASCVVGLRFGEFKIQRFEGSKVHGSSFKGSRAQRFKCSRFQRSKVRENQIPTMEVIIKACFSH